MFPPIYATCLADSDVQTFFPDPEGGIKLYPFGDTRQGIALPYATWQTIGGVPENYLACLPDVDSYLLQVDVYAETEDDAREGAEYLRNAIEPVAYIVGWRGESRDPVTMNYRYSFDVSWIKPR